MSMRIYKKYYFMSIGDFDATAVKQTPLANKWLPSICGALGGLLGLAAMCTSTCRIFPPLIP